MTSSELSGTNLTGSSVVNKRKDSDFYPTPSEATQALINSNLILNRNVWEPACGEGHMSKVLTNNGFNVASSDINDMGFGECRDFFETELPWDNCSVVTNPPFNLSQLFIERLIDLNCNNFALLLKSQYWHSQKRIKLFDLQPPSYILALTWRLDFCFGERGGAPTMECLWVVWNKHDTDTKYRLLKRPI